MNLKVGKIVQKQKGEATGRQMLGWKAPNGAIWWHNEGNGVRGDETFVVEKFTLKCPLANDFMVSFQLWPK